MNKTKIIVLDDDPTGSQTVHSCLLLTQWDPTTLREAIMDSAPIFFVLTNTRAMDPTNAARVTREVCHNVRVVLDTLEQVGVTINPIFVSRSDSTLRGHYPVETDVMAQELGPFDAHFLTPAFFEGGRITRGSIHYLRVGERWVPVHETEFARDSLFAYHHSYLPDYVAEKTAGRIPAHKVQRFSLDDIYSETLSDRLLALSGNTCCVFDAEQQEDLNRFAEEVRIAARRGKRFLFRSAASLLTSLARLPAQPVAAVDMGRWVRNGAPGVVIVGSHVAKTTAQLQRLLQQPGIQGIEIDVATMPEGNTTLLNGAMAQISAAHHDGLTAVVYTSRVERQFPTAAERVLFGEQVSALLMDIERSLPVTIGFLISKGGITSNDTLSTGLKLRTARLLGQILPGVSVVRCPVDHPRYPDLPVVIFPGNVGDENALATAYQRLSTHSATIQMAP